MNILITGGAGFIGANLCHYLIKSTDNKIHVVDSLTYAGNKISLKNLFSSERFEFSNIDINDSNKLEDIFNLFKPNAVMHLAAESHVDRSILSSDEFIKTNIIGTINLLKHSNKYWNSADDKVKEKFIFHHISTDEVYGSLDSDGLFSENSPYDPSSPYSASKASSDHFVRVWNRTYGLPTLITNCSNNYGPYQNKEKLIPMIITNAINGHEIPIYGDGANIRDWLYVEDHVKALYIALINADSGKTYNIGGNNEFSNNEVVKIICDILQKKLNKSENLMNLVKYVSDRKGHDKRYAIDSSLIQKELSWKPCETFETGIEKTIDWYINNINWIKESS